MGLLQFTFTGQGPRGKEWGGGCNTSTLHHTTLLQVWSTFVNNSEYLTKSKKNQIYFSLDSNFNSSRI